MNGALEILQSAVDERLFSAQMFSSFQVNRMLSARESREFEEPWLRTYAAVSAIAAPAQLQGAIDGIREAVYLKVYSLTQEPDLAAYASDDFGLIASALAISFEDPWLNALFARYLSGEFPHGYLAPVSGNLADLVHKGIRGGNE